LSLQRKRLTFPPGLAALRVPVEIVDDSSPELLERIGLRLLDAENAVIGDGAGFIYIDDND